MPTAAERPKLNLQKRTKPLEEQASTSTQSSIFGGAKPVDTAAKERAIEQKKQHEAKAAREESRQERQSEQRSSRSTSGNEKAKPDMKSWRDTAQPGGTSNDKEQDEDARTASRRDSSDRAEADDNDDGWQEAGPKKVSTRGAGRGGASHDRRDNRGPRSNGGRQEESNAPGRGGSSSDRSAGKTQPRPAPVVKEERKVYETFPEHF